MGKVSKEAGFAGLLFACWVTDYFTARLLGFPWMYCAGKWLLAPVLSPWSELAMFAACVWLAVTLVRRGVGVEALQVIALMVVLGGLPQYTVTLFAWGHASACN